jgi:hypothetical protein
VTFQITIETTFLAPHPDALRQLLYQELPQFGARIDLRQISPRPVTSAREFRAQHSNVLRAKAW